MPTDAFEVLGDKEVSTIPLLPVLSSDNIHKLKNSVTRVMLIEKKDRPRVLRIDFADTGAVNHSVLDAVRGLCKMCERGNTTVQLVNVHPKIEDRLPPELKEWVVKDEQKG